MTRIFVHLSLLANRISRLGVRHKGPLQAIGSLLAICLGFWGWTLESPAEDLNGILSNLFRTFQLITLNFPSKIDHELPWQLQVARLAVPVFAAIATFNILVGSITRPARLALLPHTQEHIIVTGAEQLTDGALRQLARAGNQIVTVETSIDQTRRDEMEGLGLTMIEADPLRPGAFRKLNLAAAAALFVLNEDDLENINTAMLAIDSIGHRAEGRGRLNLVVLIEDEELATEMEAALDTLSRKHGLRYQRVCSDREALRSEMARFAPVFLKDDLERSSHVLVVGLAGNWRQNLLQLIVSAQDHPEFRPVISIVATEEETAAFTTWRETRPELELVASFQLLSADDGPLPSIGDMLEWRQEFGAPDLAVVLRGNADALMTTLRLRRPECEMGLGKAPILVRQTREDHIMPRLASLEVAGRDMANLVPFGGLIRADTIARALDRKGDERAIALHDAYRRAYGQTNSTSAAATTAWDDLPESMRDANRSSAAHLPIMLASIGIRASANTGTPPALTTAQIDRLARIEHRRWCADRIERGWRFGPTRDDGRKLHPSLVAFEALTEQEQHKDREAVSSNLQV